MAGNKIGDNPYDFTLTNVLDDQPVTLSGRSDIGNDRVILLSFIDYDTFKLVNDWGWIKHLVYIKNAIDANLEVIAVVFNFEGTINTMSLSDQVDAYNTANSDYQIDFPVLADDDWNENPADIGNCCTAQVYRHGFVSAELSNFLDDWRGEDSFTGTVSEETWSYIIWNGNGTDWSDFKIMDKWHQLCTGQDNPVSFNRLRLLDSSDYIIKSISETDLDTTVTGVKTGNIDSSLDYELSDIVGFNSNPGSGSTFYNTQAFVIERITNLTTDPTILYTVPAENTLLTSISDIQPIQVIFSKPVVNAEGDNYPLSGTGGSSLTIAASYEGIGKIENMATLTIGGTLSNGPVTITLDAAITDTAGTGLADNLISYSADTLAPEIESITSLTDDGTYGTGDDIEIAVNFSEPVTLSGGNLNITLDTGAVVEVTAETYPASQFTGTYTVSAGDNSDDLNASSAALSAGTLKDAAGYDASLALPDDNNLSDNKNIVIDTSVAVPAYVYVRDSLSDDGTETTTGNRCTSPDIIVFPDSVDDPHSQFNNNGSVYGTNNIEIGNPNYIYIRVLNNSSTPSGPLKAKLCYTPLAVTLDPGEWEDIEIDVDIPSVPAASGGVAGYAISSEIVWNPDPSEVNLGFDSYCLIAMFIENSETIYPDNNISISNWDTYLQFIHSHKNVAYKNITTQDQNANLTGFSKFHVQGFNKKWDLELNNVKLPKDAIINMYLNENLIVKSPELINFREVKDKKTVSQRCFQIKEKKIGIIRNISYPDNKRYQCAVKIQLPRGFRDNEEHMLRVSQKIGNKIFGSVNFIIRCIPIEEAEYIGLLSTHLVHKKGCKSLKRARKDNMVPFDNLIDARVKGFDPAIDCINKPFKPGDISGRLQLEILKYINRAKSYKELQKKVKDTPGIGYSGDKYGRAEKKGIGLTETTAREIIEQRDKLGGFKKLDQVSDIRGVGMDTFIDIVNSFK